jgi:hypothetical protein
MSQEVKLNKALTVRSILISIIFTVVIAVLSNLSWLYTTKGELITAVMLPFIYIPLVNAVLGRISPKLRLSAAELVPLLFIILVNGGVSYVGGGGQEFYGNIDKTITAVGAALNEPFMAAQFQSWVPSYMFPKDSLTLSIWQNGLRPGQTLPLGEFIVPVIYWSLYMLLIFGFSFFLIFGIYGKRWVDVENLVFPYAVANTYIINASVDVDENNRSRWFSFKVPEYKVFWVSFLVGLLTAALPVAAQFLPALVPGTQEYGATPIEFPAMAAVLPSTMARGTLEIPQVAVWLLIPTNALATIFLVWVVLGVIYPAVAVQAGWIPYQPGVEFRWSWEDTPGNWYPFPFEEMWIGVLMGLGIVTLWSARDRIREMYDALKGKDVNEYGLSLRTMSIFGIVVTLGMLVFLIASGVPPVIALIMLILMYIIYSYIAKLQSQFYLHVGDFIGWGGQSWAYAPGAALGYWPASPTIETGTYASFATVNMETPLLGCWTLRCSGLSPGGPAALYKVARDVRANMKDILLASIIIALVFVPVTYITYVWILGHGGGIAHTHAWGSWVHWWKYGFGVTGFGTGITGETNIWAPFTWHALGMVVFFIIYAMRMKFSWFFIDPAAFAFAAPFMDYNWLIALVTLIVRIIMIRAVGTTRFTRYATAIASGVIWGNAAPILLLWFVEFTTAIVPGFMSFYVP